MVRDFSICETVRGAWQMNQWKGVATMWTCIPYLSMLFTWASQNGAITSRVFTRSAIPAPAQPSQACSGFQAEACNGLWRAGALESKNNVY